MQLTLRSLSFVVVLVVMATAVLAATASAQEVELAKGDFDVDFLFNYYDQDGGRSPVTGGVGTEDQQVGSTQIILRQRLSDEWQMSYQVGADSITSASVDAIDFDVSSASRQDTRAFGSVTATRTRGDHTLRARLGFSGEYDYQSVSLGGGWSGDFHGGNTTFSVDLTHYADNVELYDIDGVDRGDDSRSTTDVTLGLTQVLGPRTLLSAELYLSEQSGFLSTPFHEVILAPEPGESEGVHVAERLPDARSRQAVGLWLNHSFSRRFVLRSHVRAYDDDWGIQALTASLEPHFRISSERSIWVFPILRYHDQDAADSWGLPGTFTASTDFYTADPDLSEFTSEKIGLGFSWRADPARGNHRWLRSFETRIANYTRDYATPMSADELSAEEKDFEATTISIALGFRF